MDTRISKSLFGQHSSIHVPSLGAVLIGRQRITTPPRPFRLAPRRLAGMLNRFNRSIIFETTALN